MNSLKLIAAALAGAFVALCTPAHAGPDFVALEQARQARAARMAAAAEAPPAAIAAPARAEASRIERTDSAAAAPCPAAAPALLPDHGPRPATTPQANQLRRTQFQATQGACAVAMR